MTTPDDIHVRPDGPRGPFRGHLEVDPDVDHVVEELYRAVPEPDVRDIGRVQLPKIVQAAGEQLGDRSRAQGPTGRPPSVTTSVWHVDRDVPPRRRVRAARIRLGLVAAAMSVLAVSGTAFGLMNPQVRNAVDSAAGQMGIRLKVAPSGSDPQAKSSGAQAKHGSAASAVKPPKTRSTPAGSGTAAGGSSNAKASGKPAASSGAAGAASPSTPSKGAATAGTASKGASSTAGAAGRAKAKPRTVQSKDSGETR